MTGTMLGVLSSIPWNRILSISIQAICQESSCPCACDSQLSSLPLICNGIRAEYDTQPPGDVSFFLFIVPTSHGIGEIGSVGRRTYKALGENDRNSVNTSQHSHPEKHKDYNGRSFPINGCVYNADALR